MNLISKRVDLKLNSGEVKKLKKNVLENTIKFSKKFNINLIYQNIDFLTIKIKKLVFCLEIENICNQVYSYDDLYNKNTNLNNLYGIKKVFDKFYIIYTGLAFGNQKKIYSIFDFEKNKIGQIILKNDTIYKTNSNVINEIEFKGLFFKCYSDYLQKFFGLLDISKKELNIVKRLDYCVDFAGIEVFKFLKYIKLYSKKSKVVNALTGLTKKNILDYLEKKKETAKISDLENKIGLKIKYGTKETYIKYSNSFNDLKIYDKILDVLDQHKTSLVNGINPYKNYLDSNVPITRIEYKKHKFSNLYDNSIDWLFDNIEKLFFDYLLRFFNLDLSLYKGIDVSLNGKKSFLAKEEKQKKLEHSMQMAKAYLKNIESLTNKDVMFRFLFKNFPDLENKSVLDLISQYELKNFFAGLSYDLIDIPEFYDYYKTEKDKEIL